MLIIFSVSWPVYKFYYTKATFYQYAILYLILLLLWYCYCHLEVSLIVTIFSASLSSRNCCVHYRQRSSANPIRFLQRCSLFQSRTETHLTSCPNNLLKSSDTAYKELSMYFSPFLYIYISNRINSLISYIIVSSNQINYTHATSVKSIQALPKIKYLHFNNWTSISFVPLFIPLNLKELIILLGV